MSREHVLDRINQPLQVLTVLFYGVLKTAVEWRIPPVLQSGGTAR
jgi:hypothetical protein